MIAINHILIVRENKWAIYRISVTVAHSWGALLYHKSQKDTVLALYHTIIPACSLRASVCSERNSDSGQEGRGEGENDYFVLFSTLLHGESG